GVALNPDTPVGNIVSVMSEADLILVMSVYPGFSGQEFIPGTIAKVADIRKKLDALLSPAWIEVDGGISVENVQSVKNAGATAFVAATAVFKHPRGTEMGIKSLRDAVRNT
ncbi:MAG: ribulose-phosphate 3-epimerase, partial [Anaerolineae bacterium]|nr:ribulose-phosphate 3-epimerase [Anaerolineae bacterium]